jgi:hypothetical protein
MKDTVTTERAVIINVRIASHPSVCFECKAIYRMHNIIVLGIYEEIPEKE